MFSRKNILYAGVLLVLAGCTARDNDPGVEYAPQMYHSVPYEPLSQFSEAEIPGGILEQFYYATETNSMAFNGQNGKMINSLEPVDGTVARQRYAGVNGAGRVRAGQELLLYNIAPDDYATAGAVLKNPLPEDDASIVEEGKHLYLGFCAPCHGAEGNGKGKVGEVYKGVANFQGAAYKNLPEGHLFHVITHGKGRMWPHKSQLNPEERWKVVRYVQQLQQGKM
jgi:mono/diheme cytochrome c family protein